MVDFCPSFTARASEYIGKEEFSRRVGHCYTESLHTFTPPAGKYDLVWIQWVAGHLTDDDFVQFLRRCGNGLTEGGCVVLKENLTKGEQSDFDEVDNSWTRPRRLLLELYSKAGMVLLGERRQLNFPKAFYEVKMMALKPIRMVPNWDQGCEHGEDGVNTSLCADNRLVASQVAESGVLWFAKRPMK